MDKNHSPSRQQSGSVLLEALIAILLFSFGVLALVGLQANMSKNVSHSKIRSEASFLANQLIGTMWNDQPNLASYAVTSSGCTTTSNTNCTKWYSAVTQTLPNGNARVTITNTTEVDITLNWQLPGESPSSFQIGASISN